MIVDAHRILRTYYVMSRTYESKLPWKEKCFKPGWQKVENWNACVWENGWQVWLNFVNKENILSKIFYFKKFFMKDYLLKRVAKNRDKVDLAKTSAIFGTSTASSTENVVKRNFKKN